MFFDIGGWWLTCDHMFRRFGTPFACDWIAKEVNGYLYTAAIPADPSLHAEATEYGTATCRGCRGTRRYAERIGAYLGGAAALRQQLPRLVARPAAARDRAQLRVPRRLRHGAASLVELAVLLEDAIDVHDRHWKIHWMLNFAQFSSTLALNATIAEVKGEVDPTLPGRLQSSVDDRNWDSIEALWRMKEEVKGDAELRAAFDAGETAGPCSPAPGGSSESAARFLEQGSRPTAASSATARRSGRTSSSTRRGARTRRRSSRAMRGYLETDYDYPAAIKAVKRTSRRGRRAHGRCREARRPGAAAGRARPLAGHEPAHARPSLLHRPGERTRGCGSCCGHRAQAGRGEGCSTTPRT